MDFRYNLRMPLEMVAQAFIHPVNSTAEVLTQIFNVLAYDVMSCFGIRLDVGLHAIQSEPENSHGANAAKYNGRQNADELIGFHNSN